MKRLLFAVLMMVCSVSWAEWELVGKTNSYATYVDKSTVRRDRNKVKMWSMRDYYSVRTASGAEFLSTKILDVYDCQEEASALVSIAAYSEQMGTGKFVQGVTYQQTEWNWEPVVPDSIGKKQWQIACNKW
jgi:hypothetical protein